ncbi:T9SS outer membrane translocon Sov/SprA [Hymenobacter cavernae]|uniref:Cell surface protein SprA n=1 Tax=Hymenobacter cavernae TaxID=2044852 RepID=A0ABQ1TM68_9BACT|nr:cell surface protein SprA [Hymenobacter cavernae]GGE98951.1 cell surface protein SprA [Hymenobacter cavernae]
MNTGKKSLAAPVVIVVSLLAAWWSQAAPTGNNPFALHQLWDWLPKATNPLTQAPDTPRTTPADTSRYRPSRRPKVGPQDRIGTPFSPQRRRSPLILPLPSNVKMDVTPDDSLQFYDIREKIGSEIDYRDPSMMSAQEYARWQQQQAIRNYFREKSAGGVAGETESPTTAKRLIPKIYLGPMADRIFGGSYVDIRPQGSVTLRMGAQFNRNYNPTLTLRQQKVGDFQYDQNMNLNLTGQIGEKLRLTFNYDTKAAFDFENNMKLDYTGFDTDIIRKVELGNVSLPLNNSLIQGGQNLFGAKAQLQFGRLSVTTVASTLRGQADAVVVQNGAQSRNFEVKASAYEYNRHFFLSQFFRDRYDATLRSLPTVQSGIEIRRLEVYVTNDNRSTENLRNVITLMDLAEPTKVYRPQFLKGGGTSASTAVGNNTNLEFSRVTAGGSAARGNLTVDGYLQNSLQLTRNVDYERVRARKLSPNEYTFNPQLGYLSLTTQLLPEQVLGVSYEYLYRGKTYKVGELTEDYANVDQDEVIFLKMLKATNPGVGLADPTVNPQNPNLATRNLPTWDLMMKNIYSLNASQLNRDNFRLNIIYKDDQTGVDLISLKNGARVANIPLVQVFNLDNVNPNNDRNSDGNFDFFPGITIDPELGRIIFPNVEPFGSYLRSKFDAPAEQGFIDQYVYQELYNQTQSDAQQVQVKDKFVLRGRFQATSTDEINLPGIGVAQGSVRVMSGSTLLQEGVDYQVFYDQAKVKILNPSYLNSANALNITFEKNAVVQVQPRKLLGARFDYRLNQDVNFGATVLHLTENQAPGINRVNIGDEPGNNTMYGLDVNMRRESRALTKYLDALPFISTKEPSSVAFSGEFAQFVPGKTKLGRGENGVSYIDDFENASTPYTLGGTNVATAWRLAATPSPLVGSATGRATAYNRAKLAWYTIDQTYYTNGPSKPAGISDYSATKNHYTRGILRTEVFPNRDVGATGNGYEYPLDLAYYPNERGQYNYNPQVSSDGKFLNDGVNNAVNHYGGISREITFDTDFDNANVEFLEFWLLDPFIKGPNGVIDDSEPNNPYSGKNNTTGGDLYLNLGSVSEDALRDNSQYEFENGLPDGTEAAPSDVVRPTDWGRVTRQQFLTDAFSTAPGGRTAQDVGLDGYGNTDEQRFFQGAYSQFNDPSADDFRHHLDDSYGSTQILGRYKQYNGMEGNSRENSQQSSTAYPDKEDLNRDNVISDTERYYEYRVRLQPDQLQVGQNYIVDKVTASLNGTRGDSVNWYQFRIPIRQYSAVRGNNNQEFGFKSIRFLRMYLTQWQQPVVLRMLQMQFIANQWRRFQTVIGQPGQTYVNTTTDADAFNISTVSLEANGTAFVTPGTSSAIPYVLPRNIQRDREYGSTTTSRQQNEQSLRLCVDGLRDGFSKAAYKNTSINMLRYKQLRMFLHAESEDQNIKDGDVRGFVRIGTDYTQNYYEYSLPLKITRPTEPQTDQYIWPEENEIQISFKDFIDAKAERNQKGWPYTIPYVKTVTAQNNVVAQITILGNPDFSAVQGVMIGVQNPVDDKAPKSLCIWADEFRVYDFDREGGFAATARFNTKLADVANITATGSYTSVGFGGLQSKLVDRTTSSITRGDLNATVAADKFLPASLGLRVPVLVQAGIETAAPKYDPLDPDTELSQSLQKFENAAERNAYKKEVISQTRSRSISVLNVHKERVNPEKKVMPYDIENFALSYALTERTHTDINTDRDYTKTYTGALAYTYQTTPKSYSPLAKVKLLDNPYLKIFQDINFTPLPSRFSFRADLDRRYNELLLQRVLEVGQLPTTAGIAGVYQKSFFFNRIYDLKWDLTKSLILDYTAQNRGVIDEGAGPTLGNDAVSQQNRQLLRDNLFRRGGRTTNFNQTVAATYRLPLDKFPLTDWISSDIRYQANYSWQAASTALRAPVNPANLDDTTSVRLNLGNTIQNNREISANGKIDLVKLYNKVRFLNIINNAPAPGKPIGGAAQDRPVGPQALGSANAAPKDTTKAQLRALKAVLRSLMTARSINFTYARSNGTLLPGYLPNTRFFGFNSDWNAPGLPFILGQQFELDDLYQRAARNGWYTQRSDLLNTPLSSLLTENLTLRTALEPFRDFNIQIDARQQLVRSREAFYRLAVDTTTLLPFNLDSLQNPQQLGTGSFSSSFITIQTLFGDRSANGNISKAFNRFVANRAIVRDRLAAANPRSAENNLSGDNPSYGTNPTYGYNSQDVLLPAFLDAYRGKTSDGYKATLYKSFTDILKMVPLPNWRIDYNGLAEIPFIKRYFRSITLNHAYSSVYSVANYNTAAQYATPSPPKSLSDITQINASGQFIPYYVIGQVTISEQLAPLIGLNFTTVDKLTGRIEYRTSRNIGLNTTNAQVTELYTTESVIGLGFVTNRLKLPFRVGGEQRVLRNELNARLDLAIRDNTTIQRSIEDIVNPDQATLDAPRSAGRAVSQTTNGNRQVQLRPTIDYTLNQRLNLQFYFTRTVSEPRVSNSFKNTATEGGIQLRYSLSQ